MALAFTLRADTPSTTNAASYATAAFTPAGSALILVAVQNSKASIPDTPTLDSPSWLSGAWTQETTISSATGVNNRVTIFSGRTVASPGSAALTASFAAVNQTGANVFVCDVTGFDTSTPTKQAKTGNSNAVTSISITLTSALTNASSATFAAFSHDVNEVHNPSGSETELADSGYATPNRRLSNQFIVNSTTSGVGWTTSGEGIVAALEVVAAGGTTFNDSGSGTITLSGAGSESQSHTASGAGTVTLSGSGVESFQPPGFIATFFNDMTAKILLVTTGR